MAINKSSPQQEANFLEEDDDTGSDKEAENTMGPKSDGQDTSVYYESLTEHNFQPQHKLKTIPEEEEPQTEEKQDIAHQDTVVFTPDESEEEPLNTAIDDTSEDPTIVMGKPVTTTFVSDDMCIPTEKVGCLQVTSLLQEFLNHFPPESKEKVFEQIYQILQVLDAYLIDNPQQHQYCMSPDSKYISLITYATKIEIDLCNFLAIWEILSILLDTRSNELKYVKTLQQVVNNYYEKCPMEVMGRLELQTAEILHVMYDSVTNQDFDRVSDDVDSISGAVDNDSDKINMDNIQMPYDNDNVTGQMKCEQNMTNELKDVGTNDTVPYERNDNEMTKVKWSIETNDVDNDFIREYNKMHKSMEDRQINDFYEAQRHIQSAMMGDTPVKTVQNRQCIDNVSDYDSEHYRITKSVHHKLDLGPNSLLGAQQHTTVESAAALKKQDKIEGKFKAHIQSDNGQYRNEMYKRAENMIPQLDGTFNVSDSSDTDLHDYLDLASSNIIPHRTRGQKQRYDENEMIQANRCSAHIEYIKPNTKAKKQRQKVPDDEDIDMAKIVKDDKPTYDRQKALETKRQIQKKETKRLALAKAKQLQIEKDTKDKDTKRLQMKKAQIEALIEKHRPCTPKTPDKMNIMDTAKNANTNGQKGTEKEKEKPPHKKAIKASQIKTSQNKGDKATKGKPDTLLGDPMVNTKVYTHTAKEKGQKDKVGIDEIGIFEFIFHGLLNPPELEGMDEDRLRELQNVVQEQLHQETKKRKKYYKKGSRVRETFDFVNSHLLKGVATMAKLTKTDNRQPIVKIKPTDKMVMMPSLFYGTKPATSKQHYERFNLYINFQTKSGCLTDPIGEAIDLFKHTLDKTALVWFQMNRSKFKDLTMLKMMFL